MLLSKSLYLLILVLSFPTFNHQNDTTIKVPRKIIHVDSNLRDARGMKTGLWIEDNGQREVYYKENQLDGIFKVYFKINGKLYCFGEYKRGKRCGTWYYFNENSELILKETDISLNIEKSVKRDDGVNIKPPFKSYIYLFYPNGNIEQEGLALYDEVVEIFYWKSGIWKYYDLTGKLIKTENN